jgi:hypothetical protein
MAIVNAHSPCGLANRVFDGFRAQVRTPTSADEGCHRINCRECVRGLTAKGNGGTG